MRSIVVAALMMTACGRHAAIVDAGSAPAALASVMPSSVAIVDAVAPRPDCAEPRALVQLGSHRPELAWVGDALVSGGRAFDPETLADLGPAPAAPKRDHVGADRIEQRGATIVRVDPSGAVRWTSPLKKGESFVAVDGNDVVIQTVAPSEKLKNDGSTLVRVLDVDSGAARLGLYDEVARGVGLVVKGDGADVLDLASRKTLVSLDACGAGGLWDWSLSRGGRFLVCDSNRAGETLWDLQHPAHRRDLGFGDFLAPDDSYAVAVPELDWSGNVTRATVDLDRLDGKPKPIARDVPAPSTYAGSNVPLAFCGDGHLFAIVGKRELSIHRGQDGARLAGAPAMPGGTLAFDPRGRFVVQSRAGASTVYRLEL